MEDDQGIIMHYISEYNKGTCSLCGDKSTHKIGEEIPEDDPAQQQRHNFTNWVCCDCFRNIMGPAVFCPKVSP